MNSALSAKCKVLQSQVCSRSLRQPCRRLIGLRIAGAPVQAAGSSSPQPLMDLALKIPGAGRLASKAAESISNPKESKRKQQEQQQQQEEQEQARQQEELEQLQLQQQQEEQLAQEAAAAATGNILAAAEELQQATAAAAAATADAAVLEAVQTAVTSSQLQQLEQELSEYTEEEVPAQTLQERASDAVKFLTSSGMGKGISIAAGLFLGATFVIALYRSYQKFSSPRAQRKRVIDKNKLLNEELSKYLPDRRSELTPAVVQKLRGQTGFTAIEVFRKYLWFLLRERQFDAAAVEDMVALKAALSLTDDDVAEALRERAQRIYDKYGTLMLNVDGMTAEGLERKATCQALFRKLLYLTEHEPLVAAGSEAFKTTDLRLVFGATDEDVARLRIVSLFDVDIDKLDDFMGNDQQQEEQKRQQDSSSNIKDTGSEKSSN